MPQALQPPQSANVPPHPGPNPDSLSFPAGGALGLRARWWSRCRGRGTSSCCCSAAAAAAAAVSPRPAATPLRYHAESFGLCARLRAKVGSYRPTHSTKPPTAQRLCMHGKGANRGHELSRLPRAERTCRPNGPSKRMTSLYRATRSSSRALGRIGASGVDESTSRREAKFMSSGRKR